MQMLALLCVWLVAIVGTAQVAHVHGDWLPKTDTHLSAPGLASEGLGEEHCPLCVAMHTARLHALDADPDLIAALRALLWAEGELELGVRELG